MKKIIVAALFMIPSLYAMDKHERKLTQPTWADLTEQYEREQKEHEDAKLRHLAAIEYQTMLIYLSQQRIVAQQAYTNALLEHLIKLKREAATSERPVRSTNVPPALVRNQRSNQ